MIAVDTNALLYLPNFSPNALILYARRCTTMRLVWALPMRCIRH
jgi:hypothetical protein